VEMTDPTSATDGIARSLAALEEMIQLVVEEAEQHLSELRSQRAAEEARLGELGRTVDVLAARIGSLVEQVDTWTDAREQQRAALGHAVAALERRRAEFEDDVVRLSQELTRITEAAAQDSALVRETARREAADLLADAWRTRDAKRSGSGR
jgi:predicted  nucleic acid-binding Zn-ribbon protein